MKRWGIYSIVAALVALAVGALAPAKAVLPANAITVSLAPNALPADGTATTTATMRVTDVLGGAVTDATVTLTSNGDATIGTVTNAGNGLYKATITASRTIGAQTLTAKAAAPGSVTTLDKTATATLTQWKPAAKLTIRISPGTFTAGTGAGGTLTGTLTDSDGAGVSGDPVSFDIPREALSSLTASNSVGNGVYTQNFAVSNKAGSYPVTARSAYGLEATALLRILPAAPASIVVDLSPYTEDSQGVRHTTVATDGDQVTATATVVDQYGNAVPGDHVTFTSSDDATFGTVDDGINGGRQHVVKITSGHNAGTETITATATNSGVTGAAQYNEVVVAPNGIALTLSPAIIDADGVSTSTATVTVTDSLSRPMDGQTVTLTKATGNDVVIDSVTDNHDGTYTAVITASTTAGLNTITAQAGALTTSQQLTEKVPDSVGTGTTTTTSTTAPPPTTTSTTAP